jgi:hypothetical protein
VRPVALAALALGVLVAPVARAQAPAGRPSEEDMFGGAPPAAPDAGASVGDGGTSQSKTAIPPDSTTTPPAPSAPTGEPAPGAPPAAANAAAATPPTSVPDRDQTLLGAEGSAPQHLSDYQAPENPLAIGGQLYLRSQTLALQGQQPGDWTFSAPNLLDVYLDARPNPRVRAFVLGRMQFDPTAPPGSGVTTSISGSNGGALAGTSATGFSSFTASRGPTSILDQMWIRFDILERVFVTAGKQHVRWGTGRFWQPTDYLHPIKRNPLDVFDARPGQSMLKLHVPWEARGWNFYGFGVTEDPNQATNTLRQIAGGARAEIVIFDAELGLDMLAKRGQPNRYGVDFSTGIWELDVYADVGIRSGSDFCVVRATNGGAPAPNPGGPCPPAVAPPMNESPDVAAQAAMFDVGTLSGTKVQAVGGINWSHKYNDNDMFTVGGEYFYNQPGYADTSLYPGLLLNSNNTPLLNFFYTGRHYGAVFASFPAPYSWNLSTFTISTLSNLTDQSFVSRIDYAYTLLTHLSLEAFVGVHYGHEHGEFRLGIDLPEFHRDPSLLDLGIALRAKM